MCARQFLPVRRPCQALVPDAMVWSRYDSGGESGGTPDDPVANHDLNSSGGRVAEKSSRGRPAQSRDTSAHISKTGDDATMALTLRRDIKS
jgi:hypothetical protein